MNKYLILLCVILAIPPAILAPRIYKDYTKKKAFKNTYAIVNVNSGKAIRVRDAGIEDGTKIILYSRHNWECITWDFIELGENAFLLKNLYTQKTFQPSTDPKEGVNLCQRMLGGSRLQYWEFVKQPNETYLIRLKGTELYVTASSDANNSPIVLKPKQNEAVQSWKLVRQNPII